MNDLDIDALFEAANLRNGNPEETAVTPTPAALREYAAMMNAPRDFREGDLVTWKCDAMRFEIAISRILAIRQS